MKADLTKTDYLEIMDMSSELLMSYSKAQLISCIGQLTEELKEMENKLAGEE